MGGASPRWNASKQPRVYLIRRLDDLPDTLRHGAVTIGNFDGVHLGHGRLVELLLDEARRRGGPAVVFTFDPPPANLLRPAAHSRPLTSLARKAELLGQLGVDAVIAYPTDPDFLHLPAKRFFDQVIVERLAARAMVEGPNFYFGHDREGDVEMLGRLCGEADIVLRVAEPIEVNGRIVSSTLLRRLVAEGRLDEADRMLTQPYRLSGLVVRGEGRGASLGFPTANLERIETLLPAEGIYAGRAWAEGRTWPAAISLGPNPTFDGQTAKVEVNLIGYSGDLYGAQLAVDFLARLRDIVRFDSVERLVGQMHRDVAAARRLAAPTIPQEVPDGE
ncbi:MAG: bifunctional riboflavin kinase/FAD synthetase [Pirellulales bacterium]|nr:bifunctional riboflavin kinase/FAD synthetase [Pirellulales bacterium]